jgi:RNA polymerase sigma factor (TIGR02999 family)
MREISLDEEFKNQIDTLLIGWDEGEPEAVAALHTLAYSKIFDLTRSLRKKHKGSSLMSFFTTSDMVHEVWCRLASADCQVSIVTRREFYNYIQQTMHSFMLDQQKSASRKKRDGNIVYLGTPGDLNQKIDLFNSDDSCVAERLSITSIIEQLSVSNPHLADIIKYKWYLGLQVREISVILDVSESKIDKDVNIAKIWLRSKLGTDEAVG